MKIFALLLCLLVTTTIASAQSTNTIYGLARQNYFSTVIDPFDSTITHQVFDSTSIRLGTYNTLTGVVSQIGMTGYNESINLTGAALNPYDNTYIFIGATKMNTLDLNTGTLINQATLSNPIGASYFDNFRFCNADSSMYGLSRRNHFDSTLMMTVGELYLAKANTTTGVISQISAASVGQSFALAGSAIDPYQMVYYYSTGSHIIGLDLYNGSIYSNATIGTSASEYFDNFTYSCADTALYGLVRKNHISYIPNPWIPGDSVVHVDSTTIKLGKINPLTGVVTTISPIAASHGGYVLNGGAAIDPFTMTYYYSNGSNMIGISMVTGLVTSNLPFLFNGAQHFDMFRNFDNCRFATAIRTNSTISINEINNSGKNILLYPHPAHNSFTIESTNPITSIAIFDLEGKLIIKNISEGQSISTINISSLSAGIYFVKVTTDKNSATTKKLIVE